MAHQLSLEGVKDVNDELNGNLYKKENKFCVIKSLLEMETMSESKNEQTEYSRRTRSIHLAGVLTLFIKKQSVWNMDMCIE